MITISKYLLIQTLDSDVPFVILLPFAGINNALFLICLIFYVPIANAFQTFRGPRAPPPRLSLSTLPSVSEAQASRPSRPAAPLSTWTLHDLSCSAPVGKTGVFSPSGWWRSSPSNVLENAAQKTLLFLQFRPVWKPLSHSHPRLIV